MGINSVKQQTKISAMLYSNNVVYLILVSFLATVITFQTVSCKQNIMLTFHVNGLLQQSQSFKTVDDTFYLGIKLCIKPRVILSVLLNSAKC